MFNCDPGTIHAYLTKFGIQIHRDYSSQEYEEKRRLRKLGLSRFADLKRQYGNRCQVCGRTENLLIHHMWYLQSDKGKVNKNYTTGNKYEYYNALYLAVQLEPDRFRLLCSSCHKDRGTIPVYEARVKKADAFRDTHSDPAAQEASDQIQ